MLQMVMYEVQATYPRRTARASCIILPVVFSPYPRVKWPHKSRELEKKEKKKNERERKRVNPAPMYFTNVCFFVLFCHFAIFNSEYA